MDKGFQLFYKGVDITKDVGYCTCNNCLDLIKEKIRGNIFRKQFKEKTGEDASLSRSNTTGHCTEGGIPNWNYVRWLELQLDKFVVEK